MKRLRIASIVVALAAAQAGAQSPCASRSRYIIGAHMSALSLKSSHDSKPVNGPGAGLILGYGFTPRVNVFVAYSVGELERKPEGANTKPLLSQMDVGILYRFITCESTAVPFVMAGVSSQLITTEVTITDGSGRARSVYQDVSGLMLALGAGVDMRMSPTWASTVALAYYAGNFDEMLVDDQPVEMTAYRASGVRFDLGLKWFPRLGTRDRM